MFASRAMNNARAQSGTRHEKNLTWKYQERISMLLGQGFFFPAKTEGQEGSVGI